MFETTEGAVDSYYDQVATMATTWTENVSSTMKTEKLQIISDDLRSLFVLVPFSFVLAAICFFGIIGNVLNLAVFFKQGFSDSVNISFFSLAISDIGCLIPMLWQSLCYNYWFASIPWLPFKSLEFQYLTAGWPHICFARITTWITLFVTIERCLCITVPLKVKQIITRRRTVVFIVAIYIAMIGSVAPVYYTTRFRVKFYPELNRTMIGLVYTPDREKVDSVSFAVNNVFLQVLSFCGIVTFTIILVIKLKSKTRWRDANASVRGNQHDASSTSVRDRKIVKMVTLVSSVFIICFFPETLLFVVLIIEPEFNIGGESETLHYLPGVFIVIMESINSSINVIIYYKMSRKYREAFISLLCLISDETTKPTGNRA